MITRSIVFLAFPHMTLLDLTGPAQVFASANDILGEAAYRLRYVSARGGSVPTRAGLPLMTESILSLDVADIDTLVLPGGDSSLTEALADDSLMHWVGQAGLAARRACSVCSGTFFLAKSGLANGKRVATHWRAAQLLQSQYPGLQVDPDALYVQDGKVWSSAGIAAGIDLALALVEADLGRRVAMETARRMVVYMRRPGNQSQFSKALAAQASADPKLGDLAIWVEAYMDQPLGVEVLAEQAGMSPRTFHRHVRTKLGVTPAKFVESIRLDAARRLLEDQALALGRVAERTGFSGPDHLIRAFERRFGMTPGVYRRLHATERPLAAQLQAAE
jgi:transcriptional regulator GlxA family with amidase domain